jgi:hypothetical protein
MLSPLFPMRAFQNVHMLLDEGICSFFKGGRRELFCGAKSTAISGGYQQPDGESRAPDVGAGPCRLGFPN